MPATAIKDELWFLNTFVTITASHDVGDGISVLESMAPKGDSPPLHIHHTEDEVFHLLEGRFRFRVGDRELELDAGETMVAPKGVPHTYRVESDHGRWLVITAHGDFERLVRTFSRPAERPELPAPVTTPSREQVDALEAACRENSIEIVGPPAISWAP